MPRCVRSLPSPVQILSASRLPIPGMRLLALGIIQVLVIPIGLEIVPYPQTIMAQTGSR